MPVSVHSSQGILGLVPAHWQVESPRVSSWRALGIAGVLIQILSLDMPTRVAWEEREAGVPAGRVLWARGSMVAMLGGGDVTGCADVSGPCLLW